MTQVQTYRQLDHKLRVGAADMAGVLTSSVPSTAARRAPYRRPAVVALAAVAPVAYHLPDASPRVALRYPVLKRSVSPLLRRRTAFRRFLPSPTQEQRILRLFAEAKNSIEIARELGITLPTRTASTRNSGRTTVLTP